MTSAQEQRPKPTMLRPIPASPDKVTTRMRCAGLSPTQRWLRRLPKANGISSATSSRGGVRWPSSNSSGTTQSKGNKGAIEVGAHSGAKGQGLGDGAAMTVTESWSTTTAAVRGGEGVPRLQLLPARTRGTGVLRRTRRGK